MYLTRKHTGKYTRKKGVATKLNILDTMTRLCGSRWYRGNLK
jgi:hypothetical protein